MKITFLIGHNPREIVIAERFGAGVRNYSKGEDQVQASHIGDQIIDTGSDAIAFCGVKRIEWYHHCLETGLPFIYFDKGYYYPKERKGNPVPKMQRGCWRVSVNQPQPVDFLRTAQCPPDRWRRVGCRILPWRKAADHSPIIIAGSSPKYHLFHGLPDPTTWAKDVIETLRRYTDRPIIYRPKPSWREAVPIDGVGFSRSGNFEECASTAHVIVTHSSNASLIGMLGGIPSIILGNGVLKWISSTSLADVEDPYLATDEERQQLLYNLAYTQFTLYELNHGYPWKLLKRQFDL